MFVMFVPLPDYTLKQPGFFFTAHLLLQGLHTHQFWYRLGGKIPSNYYHKLPLTMTSAVGGLGHSDVLI